MRRAAHPKPRYRPAAQTFTKWFENQLHSKLGHIQETRVTDRTSHRRRRFVLHPSSEKNMRLLKDIRLQKNCASTCAKEYMRLVLSDRGPDHTLMTSGEWPPLASPAAPSPSTVMLPARYVKNHKTHNRLLLRHSHTHILSLGDNPNCCNATNTRSLIKVT